MKYLFLGILVAAIIIMYFYYEHKLITIKKQLMITSIQYRKLRDKNRDMISENKNLNVRFSTPTLKTAITNDNAIIYLAPLVYSPKLRTLTIKMEVSILDTATINTSTWFYVNLPLNTEYNCRGWICKNDFSLLYPDSKDIYPL